MDYGDMGKIQKKLGDETVQELDGFGADDLRKVIVRSQMSIEDAKEELAQNREFLKAKESVTMMASGFNEVKGRQGAKIKYAMHRLRELGKGE